MPLTYSYTEITNRVIDVVKNAITNHMFPVIGKKHVLDVEDVRVDKEWDPGDIQSIMNAKLRGRTWGVPVVGTLVLKDINGKVLDRKTDVRLGTVPAMTRHFSFVVDGKEFDVGMLRRLKSGVYHRIKANGEIESHINAATGLGFRLGFDPQSRKFVIQYGSSNVALQPVLAALGVPESELKRVWGTVIYSANTENNPASEIAKLYKAITGTRPSNLNDAVETIRSTFHGTTVRRDTTKMTLGKEYDRVSPSLLLDSSAKLIALARGEATPDPRDSVVFEEILDTADFIEDRLKAFAPRIQWKVKNRLDSHNTVEDIWSSDYVNHPIRTFFTQVNLAEIPKQVNPVDMLAGVTKTTVLGDIGGISSTHNVPIESRLLDNSHLGFLDAIKTPEGDRVGITLYLPLAAGKKGREPASYVRNAKTGETEERTAIELYDKVLAFPDQYDFSSGKPVPLTKKVLAVGKKNVLVEVDPKEVDYIVQSPRGMFSIGTNLVPFIQNNMAVRASIGARYMEQALPLVHRERPLVTAAAPSAKQTFDRIIGDYFNLRSDVDGKVTKVTKDEIIVKGPQGIRRYQLYNNYPLNFDGAFINSEPAVKVGDEVTKGQLLADTNHTRDGDLALGVNLKVGYIPHGSDVFEDAILISDRAAQKLTSEHLYQHQVDLSDETVLNRAKFRSAYPTKMDRRQIEQLDEDGVIKEGTTVQPGDMLIALLRKRVPTKEEIVLKGFGKALSRPYSDASVTWDSEYPGVVERVVKTPNGVRVFVKSMEPAGVGDKLCYSADTEVLTTRGWVPFPDVTLDDEVAVCSAYGSSLRSPVTLEFMRPSRLVKMPFDGKMYVVRAHNVDLCVTPDHTLFVSFLDENPTWVRAKARDVAGMSFVVKLTAESVSSYDGPVQAAGKSMTVQQFLKLAAIVYRYGIWTSDCIVLKAYGRNVQRSLRALGISFFIKQNKGVKSDTLVINDPVVAAFPQDRLPRQLFTLPAARLREFLKLLFCTVGHDTNRKGVTPLLDIKQSLADDLQALAAMSGHYAVSIRRNGRDLCDARLLSDYSEFPYPGSVNAFEEQDGWEEYKGDVYCCTVPSGLLMVRRNHKTVVCGNSGRYGDKGVISAVIPAEEMPRTADGEPLDVIQNPLSTAGRTIVGPTLEALLAKVAKKEGNQLAVMAFEPNPQKRITRVTKTVHVKPHYRTVQTKEGPVRKRIEGYSYTREYDYTETVAQELERAGIPETEELFDPKTGKSLGQTTVGYKYFLKLVHQSEKKLSARAGGPGYDYDANMAPKGGGDTGGQRLGELGLYALLAHGALSLTREAQTFKSSADQNEVWSALQAGEPLPPPKPSFAYSKFLALLKAMGVNVERDDDQFRLLPLTDKDILEQSGGELTRPTLVLRAKDLKPEAGGLFDEDITGGVDGERWCLHGDSLVLTEYGYMPIKDIVRWRANIRVWSVDRDGKIVLARIVNWFARRIRNEPVGVLECTTPNGTRLTLNATAKHNALVGNVSRPLCESSEVEVLEGTPQPDTR